MRAVTPESGGRRVESGVAASRRRGSSSLTRNRVGGAPREADLSMMLAHGGGAIGTGAPKRFVHFSPRIGHTAMPCLAPRSVCCECEAMPVEGGMTTCAYLMHRNHRSAHLGLMVAGNSGRPGGACGYFGEAPGQVRQIHAHHTTQEEDVFSNWMLSEAGCDHDAHERLYASTVKGRWGMVNTFTRGCETLQGVDYVHTKNSNDYADAWVVREARVSAKTFTPSFDFDRQAPCTLVFCAGPNAGSRGSDTGTTARTLNKLASVDYGFFLDCLRWTLRAALDAMISEGVTVALLAGASCGIYAGRHRDRISMDFVNVVNDILRESIGAGCRGQFFERVVFPRLERKR